MSVAHLRCALHTCRSQPPDLHAVSARPGNGRQPHERRMIDALADRRRSDLRSGRYRIVHRRGERCSGIHLPPDAASDPALSPLRRPPASAAAKGAAHSSTSTWTTTKTTDKAASGAAAGFAGFRNRSGERNSVSATPTAVNWRLHPSTARRDEAGSRTAFAHCSKVRTCAAMNSRAAPQSRHLSNRARIGTTLSACRQCVWLALCRSMASSSARGTSSGMLQGGKAFATCRMITSHQVLGVFAGHAGELVEFHPQVPSTLGPRYLVARLPQPRSVRATRGRNMLPARRRCPGCRW